MKCGIVTVYNSENCGSYLQAYALSKVLHNSGHQAFFVRQNFSDHSASPKRFFVKLAKTVLCGDFKGVKRLIVRRKNFRKAIAQYFQIIEKTDGLDCCILGSDVIWDITEGLFRNRHSFFWGTQFHPTKVIAYAPSVGFVKKENLEKANFVQKAMEQMTAVSVRDAASLELLQPYCDKEIHLVCDPTYLIDRADYDAIAKQTDLEKCIFLYCYGDLPGADREAIRAIAKAEGLKTVTFGNFNSWCDICLPYDPLLFLSICDKADYVVTNTFHGTVFSTIYEKRFAVVKTDKQKVLNVLKMCGLSDKMINTEEDYAPILHGEYDYETTRKNILRERVKSLGYLNEALEERNING